MLYLTGDTHIPIDIHKLSVTKFPEQKEMTKDDVVLICGDFGGVWNNSKEEVYWRKWLDDKNFTTVFVDGNHENHDLLATFPMVQMFGAEVHQIGKSIFHLIRGNVYNISGKKIFAMGGAKSHDMWCRKEFVSWWKQELPSYQEQEYAMNVLDKNNWEVDIIVTHCAPSSVQKQLADWFETDSLTDFLEEIKNRCKYSNWFFGHYHLDKDIDGKHHVLYNSVMKV